MQRRLAHYHGAKRQLLGNQAGQVPPAWRDQRPKDPGSKILLSRLPPDVGELEVEELFRKTVGPLGEVFLIYNSQGRSKGMALVAFQRSGDAAVARAKYDGKFIDGRRPIKIEVVVDTASPAPAPTQPSLLGRLGGANLSVLPRDHAPNGAPPARKQRPVFSAPLAPRRRQKKGPRRVKKTLAQLDEEMEDYRAAIPK
jgi:THO complex subunit 4